MTTSATQRPVSIGTGLDLEPQVAATLARKRARVPRSSYKPKHGDEVQNALESFFAHITRSRITDVKRLGGGASREQFVFQLAGTPTDDGRYVLRMDPDEPAVETERSREFEAFMALGRVVPVPAAKWLAKDGEILGQAAMIVGWAPGTSRPSEGGSLVSGLGTFMPERLRDGLGRQFIDNLVAIHAFDWRNAGFEQFTGPTADAYQAARWALGWWAQVWSEDRSSALPLMTIAEKWLNANLPVSSDIVFIHGDYRSGNYLFDEASVDVTAVLDWEFCHIGDYHEDLAWAVARLTGAFDADGTFLASGLMPRAELIARYEQATGRSVNLRALHWYEVLVAYRCVAIYIATASQAVIRSGNHQEALLTLLMAAGNIFLEEQALLLQEELP